MTLGILGVLLGVFISIIGADSSIEEEYTKKIKEYEKDNRVYSDEYVELRIDRGMASIISFLFFFGGIFIVLYSLSVILSSW